MHRLIYRKGHIKLVGTARLSITQAPFSSPAHSFTSCSLLPSLPWVSSQRQRENDHTETITLFFSKGRKKNPRRSALSTTTSSSSFFFSLQYNGKKRQLHQQKKRVRSLQHFSFHMNAISKWERYTYIYIYRCMQLLVFSFPLYTSKL